MKPIPQVLLVALVGAAVIGCKSVDKPASGTFAAVRIQGHTSEQIRAATVVVFQQDGYTAVDVHRAEMVFEKPGSRWDRIAHGSWIDEAPVAVRVRVSVVPVSDGAFDLRCQAFRVRHTGEAVFEEQVPLKADQNKEFQDLLDKVPGRLAQ